MGWNCRCGCSGGDLLLLTSPFGILPQDLSYMRGVHAIAMAYFFAALRGGEVWALSSSRNPLIASLLHRAGYIEKMGTGISRIKNALTAAGEPEPIFSFDSFFTVTFKRVAQETTDSAQEKILSAIRKNPNITRNEIAKVLNATPDSIKHLLVKLTKSNRIQHIGPTKKGYWQIIETNHNK